MATTQPETVENALQRIRSKREADAMKELTRRLTDLIIAQCYLYAGSVPTTNVVTLFPILQGDVTQTHRYKTLVHEVHKNLTRRIENNEL